jgi:hypothetical protein
LFKLQRIASSDPNDPTIYFMAYCKYSGESINCQEGVISQLAAILRKDAMRIAKAES